MGRGKGSREERGGGDVSAKMRGAVGDESKKDASMLEKKGAMRERRRGVEDKHPPVFFNKKDDSHNAKAGCYRSGCCCPANYSPQERDILAGWGGEGRDGSDND
jgi:hypothetical protein